MSDTSTKPKLIIKNFKEKRESISCQYNDIWYSPDSRYAIVECSKGEIYYAIRLESRERNTIVALYVDMFTELSCEVMFRSFWADWTFIDYGFAKLCSSEPETGFFGTKCRFYFNTELYKRKYFEKHGVICPEGKRFKVTRFRKYK